VEEEKAEEFSSQWSIKSNEDKAKEVVDIKKSLKDALQSLKEDK
jgi:hypothetical protein